MKSKTIGRYEFGRECVEIVADDNSDAGFFVIPDQEKNIPRIRIGMHGEWYEVIARLLHEAYEMGMDRLMCRYGPVADMGNDHGKYVFLMTHQDLSHICGCVGDLLANCMPDVIAEYERRQPKKEV